MEILKFVGCQAAAFLPGVLGTMSRGTPNRVRPEQDYAWYTQLKPEWTPPAIVFPIVWTILYFGIGIALYASFSLPVPPMAFAFVLTLFAANLVMNGLWTPAFFRDRAFALGLALICGMITTAFAILIVFVHTIAIHGTSRGMPTSTKVLILTAAVFIALYITWLCVAFALNRAFLLRSKSNTNGTDTHTKATKLGTMEP